MATTNEYVFVSHWRVEASIDEVSEILQDALSLPRWWPSVYLAVRELEPARVGGNGEGRVIDLYTRGWLPYTLRWRFRVTATHVPHGFSLEAWGDLVGNGEWTLQQVGEIAEITYDWRVRAAATLPLVHPQTHLRRQPPLGHGPRRRKPQARTPPPPRGYAFAVRLRRRRAGSRGPGLWLGLPGGRRWRSCLCRPSLG
jgi:hypothetical protein